MSEKLLKNKILKAIKKEFKNIYVVKLSDKFVSGIPDIHVLIEGIPFYIEVKFGKNDLTPLQAYKLDNINKAGGHAFTAYSVNDAILGIKEVLDRQLMFQVNTD